MKRIIAFLFLLASHNASAAAIEAQLIAHSAVATRYHNALRVLAAKNIPEAIRLFKIIIEENLEPGIVLLAKNVLATCYTEPAAQNPDNLKTARAYFLEILNTSKRPGAISEQEHLTMRILSAHQVMQMASLEIGGEQDWQLAKLAQDFLIKCNWTALPQEFRNQTLNKITDTAKEIVFYFLGTPQDKKAAQYILPLLKKLEEFSPALLPAQATANCYGLLGQLYFCEWAGMHNPNVGFRYLSKAYDVAVQSKVQISSLWLSHLVAVYLENCGVKKDLDYTTTLLTILDHLVNNSAGIIAKPICWIEADVRMTARISRCEVFLYRSKNYAPALIELEKIAAAIENPGDPDHQSASDPLIHIKTYCGLTKIFFDGLGTQRNLKRAFECAQKATAIPAPNQRLQNQQALAYYFLGDLHAKNGDLLLARKNYSIALQLASDQTLKTQVEQELNLINTSLQQSQRPSHAPSAMRATGSIPTADTIKATSNLQVQVLFKQAIARKQNGQLTAALEPLEAILAFSNEHCDTENRLLALFLKSQILYLLGFRNNESMKTLRDHFEKMNNLQFDQKGFKGYHAIHLMWMRFNGFGGAVDEDGALQLRAQVIDLMKSHESQCLETVVILRQNCAQALCNIWRLSMSPLGSFSYEKVLSFIEPFLEIPNLNAIASIIAGIKGELRYRLLLLREKKREPLQQDKEQALQLYTAMYTRAVECSSSLPLEFLYHYLEIYVASLSHERTLEKAMDIALNVQRFWYKEDPNPKTQLLDITSILNCITVVCNRALYARELQTGSHFVHIQTMAKAGLMFLDEMKLQEQPNYHHMQAVSHLALARIYCDGDSSVAQDYQKTVEHSTKALSLLETFKTRAFRVPAIEIPFARARAHFYLGQAHHHGYASLNISPIKASELALHHYKTTIQLTDNAELLNYHAYVKEIRERTLTAIQKLEGALQIKRAAEVSLHNVAQAHYMRGDYAEAAPRLRELFEVTTDPALRYSVSGMLAESYYQLNLSNEPAMKLSRACFLEILNLKQRPSFVEEKQWLDHRITAAMRLLQMVLNGIGGEVDINLAQRCGTFIETFDWTKLSPEECNRHYRSLAALVDETFAEGKKSPRSEVGKIFAPILNFLTQQRLTPLALINVYGTLGECYTHGFGVRRDINKAFEHYTQAHNVASQHNETMKTIWLFEFVTLACSAHRLQECPENIHLASHLITILKNIINTLDDKTQRGKGHDMLCKIHLLLAEALLHRNAYNDAFEQLKFVEEIIQQRSAAGDTVNPQICARAELGLGWIHYKQENYIDALHYLEFVTHREGISRKVLMFAYKTLGAMYQNGNGVEKNLGQASEYYAKAKALTTDPAAKESLAQQIDKLKTL